jgi:hypothetical protein
MCVGDGRSVGKLEFADNSSPARATDRSVGFPVAVQVEAFCRALTWSGVRIFASTYLRRAENVWHGAPLVRLIAARSRKYVGFLSVKVRILGGMAVRFAIFA